MRHFYEFNTAAQDEAVSLSPSFSHLAEGGREDEEGGGGRRSGMHCAVKIRTPYRDMGNNSNRALFKQGLFNLVLF